MKKRLFQLDGLRFIMICIVVLSHMDFLLNSDVVGDLYKYHLKNGGLAVDFFFMLSGFGIYYVSNHNMDHSLKRSVLYGIHKIKKIYPVYLVSLIVGLLYQIPVTIENSSNFIIFVLKMIALTIPCLPLVQSLSGMTTFSCAINGVCWFLSSLFICYMFCPLYDSLVYKLNKKEKVVIGFLTTIAIIMVLSLIATQLDEMHLLGGKINDFHYGHPFLRCFYLLLGMFIAKFALMKNMNLKHGTLLEISVAFVYIVWFLFRNTFVYSDFIRLVDICVTALFLYIFAFGCGFISLILSKEGIVKLGNNTMYIFLFHYPVRMVLRIIDDSVKLSNYIGEWADVIQIILIIIFTLVCIRICKKMQDSVWNRVKGVFDFAEKMLS